MMTEALALTSPGVKKRALAHPTPQPADPQDLPTFIATEITINRQVKESIIKRCHPTNFGLS
jgi:hypothetical protein